MKNKLTRVKLHIVGRCAHEMHPSLSLSIPLSLTHTCTEMHKIQSQMGQMVAELEH